MEGIPESRPNSAEGAPERIPTREEILTLLSGFAESFTPTRELSDEKGIYLKEVEVAGEKEGEVIEYQYLRKRDFIAGIETRQTQIIANYYQDGMPYHGTAVAILNEDTGEWRKV